MSAKQGFIQATKVRARAYVFLYEEMVKAIGEKKAQQIFGRATYLMGKKKAEKFPPPALKDAASLGKHLLSNKLSKEVFQKNLITKTKNKVILEMKNCPLVEMWQQMALDTTKIGLMCNLAYKVDFGTVETAGFKLNFLSRMAKGDSTCQLEISSQNDTD